MVDEPFHLDKFLNSSLIQNIVIVLNGLNKTELYRFLCRSGGGRGVFLITIRAGFRRASFHSMLVHKADVNYVCPCTVESYLIQ